jgi:hypothetical protein
MLVAVTMEMETGRRRQRKEDEAVDRLSKLRH